jgi:acetyl-CoA C-acetyltransferase
VNPTRLPVLVGTGQVRANRERAVSGAREPLALMADALAAAERDSGVPGLLRRADAVFAVRAASWSYADLAAAVAGRIGARPRRSVDTGLGGHRPACWSRRRRRSPRGRATWR